MGGPGGTANLPLPLIHQGFTERTFHIASHFHNQLVISGKFPISGLLQLVQEKENLGNYLIPVKLNGALPTPG